jgi:hypothetical protein
MRDKMDEYLTLLRDDPNLHAKYPGSEFDQLFESTYRHKHHSPGSPICETCNASDDSVCAEALSSSCEELRCDTCFLARYIPNDAESTVPKVHFGQVASGDGIIKSGELRDRLSKVEDVIAFEMESAGVWDTFPCLFIKGVCDYADSHKNKRWQHYAAATAAAWMKAFLHEWEPESEEQTRKQDDTHNRTRRKAKLFASSRSFAYCKVGTSHVVGSKAHG